MSYENKRVAVLGLGRSGEAAACLLREKGARVTVLDSATTETMRGRIHRLRRLGVAVRTGAEADHDQGAYELAVASPGINPESPLVRNLLRKRMEMIGELELGFEMCTRPVIAITGTNGKTTTTELVARMLAHCGKPTVACGNIGLPLSEAVRDCQKLEVMTVEVSSFQLEQIRRFHPRVAVWLNFSPDHLDRYRRLEDYRQAKLRIFENQTAEDWAVVNAASELPPLKARRISFSAVREDADFHWAVGEILYHGTPVLRMEETRLRGLHNAENLMATLGVGLAMGLDFEAMLPALRDYSPGRHRCEKLAVIDEVEYINDSKSTNPDALEKALVSMDKPVVLIAGGKDKGFCFDGLKPLLAERVRSVVLIGETAGSMAGTWSGAVYCERADSLQEAVRLARALAQPGDVVLLSPGTSSFDMFASYEERGDEFCSVVESMKKKSSHED